MDEDGGGQILPRGLIDPEPTGQCRGADGRSQQYRCGLISVLSAFGPKDRLENEIRANGMEVFARIDHSAGAAKVGLIMPPTEVIIFGNARGGTPLMQSVQTVGIDLPLKALVWQDASGNTWLSYNEPRWIAQRHAIANKDVVISKMKDTLGAIAEKSSH
jgi:uncharacterized protein (DUF302 family)